MSHSAGIELEAIDRDITDLDVDAIVNSVSTHMYLGGSAHRNVAARVAKKTQRGGQAGQYHGSIVLADYQAAGVEVPGMKQRCVEILAQPVTDGPWLKLLQEISGAYMSHRIRPALIKEIPGLWLDRPDRLSQYSGRWQGLINMRNEVHDPALVDDATARDWLSRALPLWESIFELSAGLNRYELFYLEALEDFFGAEGRKLSKPARYASSSSTPKPKQTSIFYLQGGVTS